MEPTVMIKKIFLVILLAVSFSSCHKETPLEKLICHADVVKVFVYSGNALSLHYETNDIDKIKKWTNYIKDDTLTGVMECKQNDLIIFKTYEDSTVMKFSLEPGCTYVSYQLNGMDNRSSLTPAGVHYIDSLIKVK